MALSRRRPADDPRDLDRRDLASRRLAAIAADLGIAPPPPPAAAPVAPVAPVASAGPAGSGDDVPWWTDHTREVVRDTAPPAPPVPAPSPWSPPPPPPPPAPPAVPVPEPVDLLPPGRHASRRRTLGRGLRERLVDRAGVLTGSVAGARAGGGLPSLRVAHLGVVAVVAALALALTGWLIARDRPGPDLAAAPVEASSAPALVGTAARPGAAAPSSAPSSAPSAASSPSSAGAPSAAATGSVTVDVAGAVRRPGIAVLPAGSRVTDALKAAGGARPGVDLTPLNLARVLADGEQIVVGAKAPAPGGAPGGTAASGSGGGSGAPAAPGALVNLNQASQSELEALPQVGPVTAAAIIAWRDEHGGFTRLEELLEVDGIGEKTLARLTPHLTL